MKCPACHHASAPDAAFCEECGVRLEGLCPGCGEVSRPGANFCGKCGHPLVELALELPAAFPRFGSPKVYTPPHLVDRIVTSRAALEGERKQVTVLVADLKGSMELLADRDPEDARALLDPVLAHMMEAVHRFEGTVNQVMGDGIMALFGAPLALEDHAVRACYAALRIQDGVRRHSEEVRRRTGLPIAIRVGLNSGDVVVRSIGDDLHMDYTAVGQTAHLAARMAFLSMRYVEWAEGLLLAGRIDEARRVAVRAVELTALHGEPASESWARCVLGDIELASREVDAGAARAHYEGALMIAEEQGLALLRARCHLGLGRVDQLAREPTAALEHAALR